MIAGGKIAFIINTPYGPGSRGDGYLPAHRGRAARRDAASRRSPPASALHRGARGRARGRRGRAAPGAGRT
ncbi:MAG: hypothetical protein ACLTSX_11610 [Collinsella sp.]